MSRNVMERILWSLSVDRFSKEKFRADPRKFLGRFPVDEKEVRMILEFDVKAMQEMGVNPMLTLGYWIEMSPDRRVSSYNRKLGSDSAHSASIKG